MVRVQKPKDVTWESWANSTSIHAPLPSPWDDHWVDGFPSKALLAPKDESIEGLP